MRFDIAVTLLAAAAPLVSAHGAVTSYVYASKEYKGYDGFNPSMSKDTSQRSWPSYDPIMSVTDAKMLCNGGGPAPLNITVQAGQNITAKWKQWTHQQGPVMVWMYDCQGSFASCDGKAKRWFKIDQMGMWGSVPNSNNWGTAIVYKSLAWTNAIPEKVAPGNYLMRHELLALHQTNTPQFYPECVQLIVKGTGTAKAPANCLYNIPGYATMKDPGVTVDIYGGGLTSYTPPGGPVCELA